MVFLKLKNFPHFHPQWKRIQTVLGLSGVDHKESAQTQKIGSSFEWMMLLILIWLPFQWHLDRSHLINPLNGIWFAWETVTSVGYGDYFPTSWFGRLISVVIMLMGACLFSLLTANFSAYLIHRRDLKEKKENETKKILTELKQVVDELNNRLKNIAGNKSKTEA